MFQVRTVVHCVHSSPVNGTRVTRVVIKTILTQKNFNIKNTKCILLPLLCHTLATSLTPRVTRCRKLGLLCLLYMLCTRQAKHNGAQWLRALRFLPLGTRAQTQCGQLGRGLALPHQTIFQMNPNKDVFT